MFKPWVEGSTVLNSYPVCSHVKVRTWPMICLPTPSESTLFDPDGVDGLFAQYS